MSTVYVPSIFRGLLLPRLDTYEVDDEAEPDPTPPGSHWLFSPPPYIAEADLKAETVRISNPSKWKHARLDGYKLGDWNWRHVFEFPDGCTIAPQRCITLHCCPGKLSSAELEALPETDIFWQNQDGSLRRKEVLNNDHETLRLLDGRGTDIASLRVTREDANGRDPMSCISLPGVKRSQVLALRQLVLVLCYLRLGCIGVAASRVTRNPDAFLLFTVLAHTFDILSRWASSQPGVPMDDVGVVLATMGDRLSALILIGALVMLDGDARHARIFGGMLCLDIASSWLQLSVSGATGGSRPLAGRLHIKRRGNAPDFITYLMLGYPRALTVVSLGNEAFLLWSYVVASHSLPHVLKEWFLGSACALQRAWLGVMATPRSASAASAGWCPDGGVSFPEEVELAGAGVAESVEEVPSRVISAEEQAAAEAGSWVLSLPWQAMWMFFMACCAIRQLLSCIQALISMSTLSSEVIADAVGHAMQHKAQPYGNHVAPRGRSSIGGFGVDGGVYGAGGARARSRSRGRSGYRDM